jgi:hypothetical protein
VRTDLAFLTLQQVVNIAVMGVTNHRLGPLAGDIFVGLDQAKS